MVTTDAKGVYNLHLIYFKSIWFFTRSNTVIFTWFIPCKIWHSWSRNVDFWWAINQHLEGGSVTGHFWGFPNQHSTKQMKNQWLHFHAFGSHQEADQYGLMVDLLQAELLPPAISFLGARKHRHLSFSEAGLNLCGPQKCMLTGLQLIFPFCTRELSSSILQLRDRRSSAEDELCLFFISGTRYHFETTLPWIFLD